MQRPKKLSLRDRALENGRYKIVALLVTFILWFTILGRRDFVLSKELDVEFLLPRAVFVDRVDGNKKVLVKVSGPRTALKKFMQSPGAVVVDLTKTAVRAKEVRVKSLIQNRNIEVPFGVKVVAIEPPDIEVLLRAEDGVSSPSSSGAPADGL